MSVSDQATALLSLIQLHRDQACAALAAAADSTARQIRREALAQGRQQVQAAIQEARLQEAHARQVQQAEQAQRERANLQQQRNRMLARGLHMLRRQLLAHWQQDSLRQQWLCSAVAQAAGLLPAPDWQIEYPASCQHNEQEIFSPLIQAHQAAHLCFIPCPEIEAGIRICAAGTCLDATLEGLLRDRSRVEAQLLALMEEDARVEEDARG